MTITRALKEIGYSIRILWFCAWVALESELFYRDVGDGFEVTVSEHESEFRFIPYSESRYERLYQCYGRWYWHYFKGDDVVAIHRTLPFVDFFEGDIDEW